MSTAQSVPRKHFLGTFGAEGGRCGDLNISHFQNLNRQIYISLLIAFIKTHVYLKMYISVKFDSVLNSFKYIKSYKYREKWPYL